MRKFLAAAVCAMAFAIPSLSQAQDQPGWSYAYAEGVATATQRDDRGRITATMTCRPPTGDIVITDFTLGRHARRATTASVVALGSGGDALSVGVAPAGLVLSL
jgi:hypothetical protein